MIHAFRLHTILLAVTRLILCPSLISQAMGAIPITSRHLDSALPETAGPFDLGPPARPGLIGQSPEWVAQWADAAVAAVADAAAGRLEDHRRRMKRWARARFRWERVGAQVRAPSFTPRWRARATHQGISLGK